MLALLVCMINVCLLRLGYGSPTCVFVVSDVTVLYMYELDHICASDSRLKLDSQIS